MIVDPVPLMVKYLVADQPDLTHDELELLIFALYCESRSSQPAGIANLAVQSLKDTERPRCSVCNGTGRLDDGYCGCRMGRDLDRVETRGVREPPPASEGKA